MSQADTRQTVVVDCITNVSVDRNAHFNELRTIRMLATGLLRIAKTIGDREDECLRRFGDVTFSIYGRDFDGKPDSLDFLACLFHWFGTSVCSLVRLVGFIHALEAGHFSRDDLRDASKFKRVKRSVDDYVASVTELSDVLRWRNKVGAHFAITDPRPEDSQATLDASVLFPLSLTNGRYRVADLAITYSGPGRPTETSQIPAWSVTEVFESLIPRYWPNVKPHPTAPAD